MLLTSPISFPNLGITVDPSPVAFTVMGKDIYWYGIIIASGFLLAVLYMLYRAKTFGITQDDVLDLVPRQPHLDALHLGGRTCDLRRHHRRCDHGSGSEQGKKDSDAGYAR